MAELRIHPAPVEHGGFVVPLLAVEIDGHIVSAEFPPFDASAQSIGTTTCLECYVATHGKVTFCGSLPEGIDSHDVIGIRRHQDQIYWFHQHDQWSCPIIPGFPKDHVWSFPVANYERELGGESSTLPDFSIEDILRILNMGVRFQPADGLFTIPEIDNDPQGRRLLRLIDEIARSDKLQLCQPPNETTSIRIGIESPGLPECCIQIGQNDRSYAILFEDNPAIPHWLTSTLIDERLCEIAG